VRGRLRAMITDGGLTDGPAFTAALEAAYRRMWEAWCETQRKWPAGAAFCQVARLALYVRHGAPDQNLHARR
jgi:hypothetical protein